MAHKGGYPGYPQQPPPPPAGYAPPPPGYAPQGYAPPPYSAQPQANTTNTVIIQQQQPVVRGQSNRGLFGQLGHELNLLGKTVSREVDWATNQVNKAVATSATGNLLNLFQTGNAIQLIARSNGGCLEIVQGPQGLVVDGRGPGQGQAPPHAIWTVVNEGNNQVRLHNNNNYLAIINGNTVLMGPGTMHGVETKFQLVQSDSFVYLESMKERGRHIGILPNGDLKSALVTRKEIHSQFGVRLIYSPYAQTTVTTVTSVNKR